jgi:hypothetical protein
MYDWVWHRLPGTTVARAAQALLLAVVAVALLFRFVFPWVEPRLPWNRSVVASVPTAPATPTPRRPSAGRPP